MTTLSKSIIKCAKELIDTIGYDADLHFPHGGNGGLISTATMRKMDELRALLLRAGAYQ